MTTTFYRCPICGNIIIKLFDSGVTPSCCGRPMLELSPQNAADEASSPFLDKHVPQLTWLTSDDCYEADGFNSVRSELSLEPPATSYEPLLCYGGGVLHVQVGETPHPMQNDHHLQFICLVTEHGAQFRRLSPSSRPCAAFVCPDFPSDAPYACFPDRPLAVYAYCNLHGLFVTRL